MAASSRYWALSRSPRYTILFAVPLLLAYEALAWLIAARAGGVRNGADVILKSLFVGLGGARGLMVFSAVLLIAGLVVVGRDWRRHPGPLKPRVFGGMLLESAVLAALVGIVVGRLTNTLLQSLAAGQSATFDIPTQLMISLGAGIYEELLFRVILVGALAALGARVLGWSTRTAGVVACIVGALLFSAFHYVGPFGDPLELGSFTFRAIAGVTFSALYLVRGFGIAAWTHALYDVYVTLG
jgi:membrane protease YdiL (CAAX protease family)